MKWLLTILVLTAPLYAQQANVVLDNQTTFCAGTNCQLTNLLSNGSFTVDTLTLAEIKQVHDAEQDLANAKQAYQAALNQIGKAHGAHKAKPQEPGVRLCPVLSMANDGSSAPTAAPGSPDDSPYTEVEVIIRGKYAFRVNHWPIDLCSNTFTIH